MSIKMRLFLSFVLVFLAMATDPRANSATLSNEATRAAVPLIGGARAPIIEAALPGADVTTRSGSLFAGQARGGLFAPLVRQRSYAMPNFGVVGLKNLIARAEAGSAQYDAVVYSARIKPPKRPTQMTIAEIYQWIDDTPGQNHAIGRYQFIPSTLRWLVKRAKLPEDTIFDPSVQDELALMLLEDAGLTAFLAGQMAQETFMNNLAKTWAGLPNSSGKSHYDGYAGNRAVITWATFKASMDRYFPEL